MNDAPSPLREQILAQLQTARQSGETPDLSGANLAGLDLSQMDLSQARLRQANLQGANLAHARLNQADLSGANLSGCDLSTAMTNQACFDGADLSGAILRSHWFFKVSAKQAIFERADLSGAEGEECDFSQGRFAAANLAQAHFRRSSFNAANLNGAELHAARLPHADLRRATLLNADLSSARLDEADLSAADLTGADLRKADLAACQTAGAIFKDVISDERTAWPEGYDPLAAAAPALPGLSLRWESAAPEEQQACLGFAGGGVDDLALTPDGRFVVCVSRALRQVLVFDFETMQRVQCLNLHTGVEKIAGLAITDDSHFALLTTNHALRYVALDEEALTPPGVAQPQPPAIAWVRGLTLSPNGRFLLLSNDQTIELYDHRHMRPAYFLDTQGLSGAEQPLARSLCISADSRLAFGAAGTTLAGWDMPGKKKLCRVDTGAPVTALALLPGGETLLAGHANGEINAWDWKKGVQTAAFTSASGRQRHHGAVTALGVTPDGRWTLSAGEDGALKVWEAQTRRLAHNLGGHAGPVAGLALSADSEYAVTSGADGLVNKWHIASGRLAGQAFPRQSVPGPLSAEPGGKLALAQDGCERRSLGVYDLESGARQRTLRGHQGNINALAFLPDGQHLLTAADDHLLLLWDLESGRLERFFAGHYGAVTHLVVDPTGERIVSAGRDGQIIAWDLRSGKPALPPLGYALPAAAQDYAVQLSPEGRYATANLQPPGEAVQAALFDLHSGQNIRSLGAGECLFSPDGRSLASFKQPGAIHLIDLEAHEQRRLPTQGGQHTLPAAFTPDGRYLVALRQPRGLAIFDAAEGQPAGLYAGHTAPVIALAIAPDGKTAFSLDSQRNLCAWQIPAGEEIAVLQLPEPANTLAIAPDGRRVLAGGAEGKVFCVELLAF